MRARNPDTAGLMLGWAVATALTLGGLALGGFLPPHPGFGTVLVPAVLATLVQGGAMAIVARLGRTGLAWIILAAPLLLGLTGLLIFFVLFAIGMS